MLYVPVSCDDVMRHKTLITVAFENFPLVLFVFVPYEKITKIQLFKQRNSDVILSQKKFQMRSSKNVLSMELKY